MSLAITLHRAAVNGLSLHYAACGEAGRPPVILLHGFPEFWGAWEQQLLDLGRDHHAVAPDLRGFNLSDKPPAVRDYRVHHAVADVLALASALGCETFGLVGHDWGGAIAYALAIAHPARVRKLVIVNAVHPAVFARELLASPAQAAASSYMNQFRRPDAASILQHDDFAALRAMLADDGRLPDWFDAPTRELYRAAWSQPGALDGGLNYYRASSLHPPAAGDPGVEAIAFDDAALRVQAQTLMLWGERDRFLLPGCAEGVDRYVPHLRVERFPRATHWIAHEEPQAVSQLIREHLRG